MHPMKRFLCWIENTLPCVIFVRDVFLMPFVWLCILSWFLLIFLCSLFSYCSFFPRLLSPSFVFCYLPQLSIFFLFVIPPLSLPPSLSSPPPLFPPLSVCLFCLPACLSVLSFFLINSWFLYALVSFFMQQHNWKQEKTMSPLALWRSTYAFDLARQTACIAHVNMPV